MPSVLHDSGWLRRRKVAAPSTVAQRSAPEPDKLPREAARSFIFAADKARPSPGELSDEAAISPEIRGGRSGSGLRIDIMRIVYLAGKAISPVVAK